MNDFIRGKRLIYNTSCLFMDGLWIYRIILSDFLSLSFVDLHLLG